MNWTAIRVQLRLFFFQAEDGIRDNLMPLFCERPHAQTLDFQVVRFIVSKAVGLRVGEKTLKMGEEVPPGTFTSTAMRQIYEPPLRLIETFDYASKDPGLVKAAESFGLD